MKKKNKEQFDEVKDYYFISCSISYYFEIIQDLNSSHHYYYLQRIKEDSKLMQQMNNHQLHRTEEDEHINNIFHCICNLVSHLYY